MGKIIEYKDRLIFHPGVHIEDWIYGHCAEVLGIDEDTLHGLVDGDIDITPEIAEKLSAGMGTSKQMWINSQEKYNSLLKQQNTFKSRYTEIH